MKIKETSALDPIERISEILFGLIMVMTFTSSMKVAGFVADDVHEILLGALGCNLAWGIIDAFIYLINVSAERGRMKFLYKQIQLNADNEKIHSMIKDCLPHGLDSVLKIETIESIRNDFIQNGSSIGKSINRNDVWQSVIVFTLVFFTIFPLVIPFFFIQDIWRALRISNLIALSILFLLGYRYGNYIGKSGWICGSVMVFLGLILVTIAIIFGG